MINVILSETERSLVYMKELCKNKHKFNFIFIYSKKKGVLYNYVKSRKLGKFMIHLKTNNINSIKFDKKIKLLVNHINIISTYPGEIVTNKTLLKINLLHCHSGDLPKFKGSTTIYYTILSKLKICVSVFKIQKQIDSGEVMFKKYFKYPKKTIDIEKNFDHQIRARTLVSYLGQKKYPTIKKISKKYLPYYIAHPILRALVHNKNYFNNSISNS